MLMGIDSLRAYGLDDEVLTVLRRHYGSALLPIQEKALRDGYLVDGQNRLILSPTASGKSVAGEIACVKHAREGRQSFYLVPTRTPAEETYARLTAVYAPMGIRSVLSTRSHREHDQAIERLDFHVAVVAYEKLKCLLVARPALLDEVSLVVVDELELIADERRGPGLELLLTRFLAARKPPQIVGLSPILGDHERLAGWLWAKVILHERRPVDLRKGVLWKGAFHFHEHNSGRHSQEQFPKVDSHDEQEIVLRTARHLVEKGEAVVIVRPRKETTISWAKRFAQEVDLPPAYNALEELSLLEDSLAREILTALLQKGIAFYNDGLPWEYRNLIQRYTESGEIHAVFSTTTLNAGTSLPAVSTFFPTHHYSRSRHERVRSQPPALLPMTRWQFESESGRGARYGRTNHGRAIFTARSENDLRAFYGRYIKAPLEGPTPGLSRGDIEDNVLHLLASGFCKDSDELCAVFKKSFAALCGWRGLRDLEDALAAALRTSLQAGLIQEEGDRLRTTPLGKLAALKGIKAETARSLATWTSGIDRSSLSDLEVLLALAKTENGLESYIPLRSDECPGSHLFNLFRQAVYDLHEERKLLFKSCLEYPYPADYDFNRTLKKVLVLQEWLSLADTREIEGSFYACCGAIARLARDFSWLAESLACILRLSGWKEEAVSSVADLSERLLHGVPREGLPLARMHVPGLSRSHICRLIRAGYDTPEAFSLLAPKDLDGLLPEPLAERLIEEARRLVRERAATMRPGERTSHTLAMPREQLLYLDLRHPGTVTVKGKRLILTSPQFEQLAALAASPGLCVTYDDLYRAMWPEGVHVEKQQVNYHKAKLLKQLSKVLPEREARSLIMAIPGKGLLLNLRAEEVHLLT